jgi:hypothetical protein
MATESDASQPLRLEGEVVEILEQQGRRLARVRIEPRSVLDLAASGIRELHLGDRLMIDGSLVINAVVQAPGIGEKQEC